MKKKICVFAIVISLIVLISTGIYAYYTYHSDASDLIFDGFELFIYAESVQTINNKEMMEVWHYFS